MADETIETVKSTLDFSTAFGINFRITNDLIEDSQFDLIEMHLRNAGREMGEFASNEALTIMYAPASGDGTLNINAATGAADCTTFVGGGATQDVRSCIRANLADGYISDTMAVTHEAMLNSILFTIGLQYQESMVWNEFAHGTWPTRLAGMNIVYADTDIMTTNKAQTDCKTLIFAKEYALISGRKRWLRIEKYSDPIRDLVGATITARQDSKAVYRDSIAYMYES